MITTAQIKDHTDTYIYLFDLQKIGRTNMFDAVRYMVAELGMDKVTAKSRLMEWMQNYQEIADVLCVEV